MNNINSLLHLSLLKDTESLLFYQAVHWEQIIEKEFVIFCGFLRRFLG